jgi:hypothetical protein
MQRALPCSVLFACLAFAQIACASDINEIPPDQLPPEVKEELTQTVQGAEIVAASKIREGGRECYLVTLTDNGKRTAWYVAANGRFMGVKDDELAAKDLPGLLFGCLLLSIFPGTLGAAGARILLRRFRPDSHSVWLEWIAAWCGATILLAILASVIATIGPRGKDMVPVVFFQSSVAGGVAASIVQAVTLTIQSFRGSSPASRFWIVAFCLVGVAFLALSIPAAILRIERRNQCCRSQALSYTPSPAAAP